MLKSGIYNLLINKKIEAQLEELEQRVPGIRKKISSVDEGEIPILLTQYLQELIHKELGRLEEEDFNTLTYLDHTNDLIQLADRSNPDPGSSAFTRSSLRQLESIIRPDDPRWYGQSEIPRPETPISYSSLFTGSRDEPPLFSEFQKEIRSASRIDFLVSFIKWSGIRLIIEDLRQFTTQGGKLRILTTSYMGATDPKAVEELRRLENTEIRISYDTKRTRLHAKTYTFHRDNGFTTSYVGSSNLSNAAISSGLEWNMKLAEKDQSWILDKIRSTFDTYWESDKFEHYGPDSLHRLKDAIRTEKAPGALPGTYFDLTPFPFQQDLLDQLEAERKVRGHHRNLLVAATGTGKTMIAAFDFKRFRQEHPQARLLFVAHREEILKQSIASFRAVLKDNNFGELFVGNNKPSDLTNLFVSIQSFNAAGLSQLLKESCYDFIIVDEFHHSAAASYQKLLSHFRPQILLGLTATPERMDGKNILDWFDGRIAAEMRLPEAIERKLLVPFHYFGVDDTTDLSSLAWTRGGYQASDLDGVYVFNREIANRRARQVVNAMERYLTELESTRALGFCVSRNHAQFMADFFNASGIPALCLTGQSSREDRETAKARLVSGEIKIIFVVDLYNEGVDIPEINTVLFLRPTESLTIFLQQLGRGLRLAPDKDCLTVLDFIGRQHSRYSFEDKFRSLLFHKNRSLKKEIENGFMNLPVGCYIQLEKTPQRIILDNINQIIGKRSYLIDLIQQYYEEAGRDFQVDEFLKYWHSQGRSLTLADIYRYNLSFADLKALAKISEPLEFKWQKEWVKCLPKLCAIDSRRWVSLLQRTLEKPRDHYSQEEIRMLWMFQITFWGTLDGKESLDACLETMSGLRENPVVFQELSSLLDHLMDSIHFVDEAVHLGSTNPLDLHCHYSRDQLLVGLGYKHPTSMREGVLYLKDIGTDVFLVTLQKSEKHYTPTTMYKDYSINETLFHWQSQSTTSEGSPTGQRYIHHKNRGSNVLLFVRETKKDGLGTAPYTFLGLADYVSHEGSRPMSIIWKLRRPIPASYIEVTSKLGIV